MGSSPWEIIFRVYLRESIPGIVRATTITVISLIGLTAMAGVVGGGGLGDFAIRYGHQRNQVDITFATVIIILAMVSLFQGLGNLIIRRTSHSGTHPVKSPLLPLVFHRPVSPFSSSAK